MLFPETSFEDIFRSTKFTDKLKYKFYILSKGRAKTIKSVYTLNGIGINPIVVVEPQDYEEYVEHNPNTEILSMDKNDMGIQYVRNFIKEYSFKNGESRHWQLDDDIRYFYSRLEKKTKISGINEFSFVEEVVDQFENIGIAGFIHDAFAFTRTTDYELNKQVCTCFLVDNNIDVWWREDIIEDTDYSLQLLYKGYSTVNFNRFTYLPTPNASLAGGNTPVYTSDRMKKRQIKLSEQYPGYFHIYDKDGISHIKPSNIWKVFKYKPEPIYKDL